MNAYAGHNFINGAHSAQGHSRLHSFDATTGRKLPGLFTEATEQEVDAAAQAAAVASPGGAFENFKHPPALMEWVRTAASNVKRVQVPLL